MTSTSICQVYVSFANLLIFKACQVRLQSACIYPTIKYHVQIHVYHARLKMNLIW